MSTPKTPFWSPERGLKGTLLGLVEACKRGVRLHTCFGHFLGTLRTLILRRVSVRLHFTSCHASCIMVFVHMKLPHVCRVIQLACLKSVDMSLFDSTLS